MHWMKLHGPGRFGTQPEDVLRDESILVSLILSKVSVQPNKCILWTGWKHTSGYGDIHVADRPRAGKKDLKVTRRAHRVIYELLVGPVPGNRVLDHQCNTKLCVNPAHLHVVTDGQNVRRAHREMTHCRRGHELTPDNVITAHQHHRPDQPLRTCKTCHNAAARDFYHRNRESELERRRLANLAAPEKRVEYRQRNAKKISEASKAWYLKNRESRLEKMRLQREAKKAARAAANESPTPPPSPTAYSESERHP